MLVKVCVLLSLLLLQLCAHRFSSAGLQYDSEKELDIWLTGFEPIVLDGAPVTPPCRILPLPDTTENDNADFMETSTMTTTTTAPTAPTAPTRRPVLVRQPLFRLLLTHSSRISLSYIPRRRASTRLVGVLQRVAYGPRSSRRVSSDSSEED